MEKMTFSPSASAHSAWQLVTKLQATFALGLAQTGGTKPFSQQDWLRSKGQFGGGYRLMAEDGAGSTFNRASVNVSHVHYTSDDSKALSSATALSTIVHPSSPLAPSVHIHVSWTEMKTGSGYWRIMADLNPSIQEAEDRDFFAAQLKQAAPTHYAEASAQGDKYFFIPALNRHRGITHFYLEQFASASKDDDFKMAENVGLAAIHGYLEILSKRLQSKLLSSSHEVNQDQRSKQLAYHTLYVFQVLTLDRGTTSGLLVHDENDVGVLGSLPAKIDNELLKSWGKIAPKAHAPLVARIVEAIPSSGVIGDSEKRALARIVRTFFRDQPEALNIQAKGDVFPPTVSNHKN